MSSLTSGPGVSGVLIPSRSAFHRSRPFRGVQRWRSAPAPPPHRVPQLRGLLHRRVLEAFLVLVSSLFLALFLFFSSVSRFVPRPVIDFCWRSSPSSSPISLISSLGQKGGFTEGFGLCHWNSRVFVVVLLVDYWIAKKVPGMSDYGGFPIPSIFSFMFPVNQMIPGDACSFILFQYLIFVSFIYMSIILRYYLGRSQLNRRWAPRKIHYWSNRAWSTSLGNRQWPWQWRTTIMHLSPHVLRSVGLGE